MKTNNWLDEKDRLRRMCGEIMVDVLWNPTTTLITGGTEYHDIKVWREDGIVKAELKRK